MDCNNKDKTRWFYSGTQVGLLNQVGAYNFVSGGPEGGNLSSSFQFPVVFPGDIRRDIWNNEANKLNQELLNATTPFIELNWICDISIDRDTVFRVSNRNIYVEDGSGKPRFYESRVKKAPNITIGLGEWLSERFEVGSVKLTLNNRDGYFNDWLPQGEKYTQWIGTKVVIKVGYGEKLDNYYSVFEGSVTEKKGLTTTLEEVVLQVYESMSSDDTSIPVTTFDSSTSPDIQDDAVGKAVPIVYGDWESEDSVEYYGEIPAYCVNAKNEDDTYSYFRICENSLRSIGEVWLHRDDRSADKYGPIKILPNAILKNPESGTFYINKDIEAFEAPLKISGELSPGSGSGIDIINADSSGTDFVRMGIHEGDYIYLADTNIYSIVIDVSNARLTLTGGINFTTDVRYIVATKHYHFRTSDLVTVKCLGKDVSIHSKTALADSGIVGLDPHYMATTINESYIVADNTARMLYEISFRDEVNGTLIDPVLKAIPYGDISADLDQINGLDIQVDRSVWIVQSSNSSIYRYMIDDNVLGFSYSTSLILGLEVDLAHLDGIIINTSNQATFYDRDTRNFYTYNPYASQPILVSQFNADVFDVNFGDIADISLDPNEDNILLVDYTLNKFYRIDPVTGELVLNSSFILSDAISESVTTPVGIAYNEDKTIYIMNHSDLTIYNFNEFQGINENVGFIARDVLQSYAGRIANDFDLRFNQTCREDLSKYKGRLYVDEKKNINEIAQQFLRTFNTNLYTRHGKLSLFAINFDNFSTEGDIIREGDIIKGTLNPSKEYNQYFNSAISTYKHSPIGNSVESDNYVSPTGVELAGIEILKKLELEGAYRREDIDSLMPLYVRLASAEPEFINVSVGFRFLFSKMNTFYQLHLLDDKCGDKKSGRRFDFVPCFVRKITMDLNSMKIDLKLWSLGSTSFGEYQPIGVNPGGEQDQIILTSLGTIGYIAPVGYITSVGVNSVELEDVYGLNAEQRVDVEVGAAWKVGYKISFVDAETREIIFSSIITSVLGSTVTFADDFPAEVVNTIKNVADIAIGGCILRYPTYTETIKEQKDLYTYLGKPIDSYPDSSTNEIEEQKSGLHNFDDGRLPYILHPIDYVRR